MMSGVDPAIFGLLAKARDDLFGYRHREHFYWSDRIPLIVADVFSEQLPADADERANEQVKYASRTIAQLSVALTWEQLAWIIRREFRDWSERLEPPQTAQESLEFVRQLDLQAGFFQSLLDRVASWAPATLKQEPAVS